MDRRVDVHRPRLTVPSAARRAARTAHAPYGSHAPRTNRLPPWFVVMLAAVPVMFLAIFYVWPFATLLARGLDMSTAADVLGRRRTWDIAWFTLWQATASTVLTIVVGLVPAYVVARYRFPGRRLLVGMLTAVFVLPTVVVGAAFLAILPSSLDHTIWSILGAHVAFNLAVVVRLVGATWEHLPPDLDAAAATLGAPPWRVAREVTLPLLRPAITAAAAIVFVFTFTSFGVIRVLGSPGRGTLEVEVWRRATQLGDVGGAAVLAVVQLALLGVVVGWSAVSQRRHSRALAIQPKAEARAPRRTAERVFVAITAIATAAIVALPLLALVERSLRSPTGYTFNAWRTLGDTELRPGLSVGVDPIESLVTSLQTAAWATTFAVVIGATAALAIAAASRAGRLLDTGLMLPIGTSAVTIGFGMLITFDVEPYDWRAAWWLVPVGHALIAVPFVVRATLGVLRSVDPALRDAAATLGASPRRAWREVVVPHLWRPLAVGAGLAAAISLGEFGATSFLGRTGSETLPISIERLLGRTGAAFQAKGYALAAILAAATIAVVLAVDAIPDGRRDRR
jgi:thiamine transport system permease protein